MQLTLAPVLWALQRLHLLTLRQLWAVLRYIWSSHLGPSWAQSAAQANEQWLVAAKAKVVGGVLVLICILRCLHQRELFDYKVIFLAFGRYSRGEAQDLAVLLCG